MPDDINMKGFNLDGCKKKTSIQGISVLIQFIIFCHVYIRNVSSEWVGTYANTVFYQ